MEKMKIVKFALLALFCLACRNVYSGTEDFVVNYIVQSGNAGASCHALKIKENWLLTSAHCVADFCKDECSIYINFDGDTQAVAHSSKKETVFVKPAFRTESKKYAHDVALIKTDGGLRKYARAKFLRGGTEAFRYLKTVYAVFAGGAKKIKIPLERGFDFIAAENLGYVYFPVEGGLSGGPVFTKDGVILGVISAGIVGAGADVRITPFTDDNLAFITSKTSSLDTVLPKSLGVEF